MDSESNLRVGIFFNARKEQGGLYQYALTLVDCLHAYSDNNEYFLYMATLEDFPVEISKHNWHIRNFRKTAIQIRMGLELILFHLSRANIDFPFPIIPEYRKITQDHLDVMVYVKPTPHVYQWKHNAIFPIHDLQHRLQTHFPEVSANGEFVRREILYRNSVRKAKAILTDSETGKEDVIQLYRADKNRIFPLPFLTPTFRKPVLDPENKQILAEKYSLPAAYFFYPAAFWPHKNHERLIRAIALLHTQYKIKAHLVLSGSKKREFDSLFKLTVSLGLQDFVHFIGFVDEDDLPELYHHSIALVMPTFFGPTNIPVLEAWTAGCPVISSDIRGIQEQVGNAGLLVDPLNEMKIAEAMQILWTDPAKRNELIELGYERVSAWTPEQFANRLKKIIHV